MTTITAKIIEDSVANNIRITTMELEFPRFILPQFNTHRMFSRNAASSRAIPVIRNIQSVTDNPAMPIHWGKNKPGMQAREELDNLSGIGWWEGAVDSAIYCAEMLANEGYHKQIVNRLLEPFLHTKVVVTATEWDNFFKLRLHDDAQPEIQALAKAMKAAMDNSTPNVLQYKDWHLPYIREEEYREYDAAILTKASVARCARVSYNKHDGSQPDIKADIELHDKLLKAGHMSPFEHQAAPMQLCYDINGCANAGEWNDGTTHMTSDGDLWSNNFRGWIQHRALIDE